MTTKKVFGYILIIVAIILTLTIIAEFPKLLEAISGFFRVFADSADAYEIGRATGALFYWVIHFALTITLWIYGIRWVRNKKVS